MPRCHCKNITINSQDNMAPLEPSNPMTADPEYCNLSEAQGKDQNSIYECNRVP